MQDDHLEDVNDIIEGKDEDGNTLTLRVDRYFYYNGDEYVLLKPVDADQTGDASLYVMEVLVTRDDEGEEWEEFLPVEPALMEDLIRVAGTDYREDEELLETEDEP